MHIHQLLYHWRNLKLYICLREISSKIMAEQRNSDDMRILVLVLHLVQILVIFSILGVLIRYNFFGSKMQMEEEVGIFRILYFPTQLVHENSYLLVSFLHGMALSHLCKISILEVEHRKYDIVLLRLKKMNYFSTLSILKINELVLSIQSKRY